MGKTSEPAVDDPWYHVREVAPGVYCIAEPSHVNNFLVLGSERAALIDTGLAVGDLAACVRRITNLPVVVINTHYHHDHTGNNWRFEQIAIHRAGADPLARGSDPTVTAGFISYIGRVISAAETAAPLDQAYFHLFEGQSRPRPFPPGFDPARYAVRPSTATLLLGDGDRIELGRRRLRVVHTPGHTPDSICLLDSRSGVLFGGDTINTGPVYAQLDDSDVPAFCRSCARLLEMSTDVSLVAVAHFGRTTIDRHFIQEHAAGFAAVLDGSATWRIGQDYQGDCPEAVFDRFSIFVAADSPYAPALLRRL
jgi:glyoxylase-like metal-dependent hydrolase (beta-lactamase superfamily II)